MVPRVMPGPAHLHDPKLTLHPELALPREPEVEDSVDEVILFVLCICRPAWIAPSGSVRRKLSQQEGRAVQITEPSDQGEQFPPRLAELREDLDRSDLVQIADRASIDLESLAAIVDIPQEKARIQRQIDSIRERLELIVEEEQ